MQHPIVRRILSHQGVETRIDIKEHGRQGAVGKTSVCCPAHVRVHTRIGIVGRERQSLVVGDRAVIDVHAQVAIVVADDTELAAQRVEIDAILV